MLHRRPVRLTSVMALLGMLLGVLTACGGGETVERNTPSAAIATQVPEPKAAKGSDGAAAAGTLSTLSSGVSPVEAASYQAAVGKLRPAFHRFTSDYAAAMARMNADDVLAAAARLRRAVVAFDTVVRGLDLTAVQGHVDKLLALNEDFVVTLKAVRTATTGGQAVRIMEMLPFHDYLLAFDAVADAL
jgi:hypothetical protein